MQENRRGLKKSTVVILIISLVLMLGGAAMAVTGIALGGLQQLDGVTINGHPINMRGQEPLAGATVSVEQFKNMDIQADGSQVRFVDDDEYYVQSTYAPNCEPLIDVQDGTLYVRDWAAMEGGKVGLVNNKDGSKGVFVTDGKGNDVKLDGEGIKVTDEDGGQVTINGLGIHIEGEDGTDIQVGSPDDPFTIDLSGIYNEGYYEYPSIIIHCPMDKAFKSVMIQSSWMDSTELDGFKAESLTLDLESATLSLKNAQIGALTGTTEYGELTFDTCKFDAVELSGDSLTVALKDTEVAGDVTLNAGDSLDQFGMTGCTIGGGLNVKTESLNGRMENCTIAGDANIESEYGSMDIQNSTMDNLDVEGESVSLKVNGSTVKKDVVVDVEQYGDEMVVSNSTCGTFTVNGESIALNMSDTTVNKTLTTKASYGTIDMDNVTADGLTAKVNDGEISFTGTLTGKSEIATESGDINILIRGDKKDYAYALNSQDGEATVDGEPFKATVGQDKAPNTIQVNSETGGITLAFQK